MPITHPQADAIQTATKSAPNTALHSIRTQAWSAWRSWGVCGRLNLSRTPIAFSVGPEGTRIYVRHHARAMGGTACDLLGHWMRTD